jgi:hypothetical protein
METMSNPVEIPGRLDEYTLTERTTNNGGYMANGTYLTRREIYENLNVYGGSKGKDELHQRINGSDEMIRDSIPNEEERQVEVTASKSTSH